MEKINIHAPIGANKKKKIVGRGPGSGHGKTSCKGHKGQNARAGGGVRPGFEGGQMPLYRRVARRGFSNFRFKAPFDIININDLEIFSEGSTVNKESLINAGLLKKRCLPIKLLGNGEITKKLIIEVNKVSEAAKAKIEKCGGEIKIIDGNEVTK